jgi:hypothetical protein
VPRFVLLEHVGHPDDPAGLHYDLLLEEGDSCRTWRLPDCPVADRAPVVAQPLPQHRLAWLDVEAAEVSGERGAVRRLDAGTYDVTEGAAAGTLDVRVSGTLLRGRIMGVPPESQNA